MKALLCTELGPPERHSVTEVEDPVAGPGEVVVGVTAAAINFPDLLIMQGRYQVRPELPFIPGAEGAGVVIETGSGVTGVAPGDRVMFSSVVGAFAERVTVPDSNVIPLPSSLTDEQAAGFSLAYGTSYYALKQRAAIQPGETLLVLGAAGGVGSSAVELGKAMGATVIAAAGSAEKLEFAASLGADHGIDYAATDLKDAVKDLTGGLGADVVYDPVGGAFSEPALRATAWGGRFLVIGFAAGEIPRIPLNLALLKGVSLVGVFWGAWVARDPAASRQNFVELVAMADDGAIRPRVSEVYPLERHAEGFRSLIERRARGKVVLRP